MTKHTAYVVVKLTRVEADQLWLAANAGTVDDAIDNLGWSREEKAAYRRAESKLLAARYRPERG